jgi:hypothetical protein
MSDDPIIANAQNAANTPATGPTVDAVEQRRAELNRPDNAAGVWSKDPVKRRAAVAEIQRLARTPEVAAAEDQKQSDAVAKASPAEQRVKRANQNPALWNPKHKGHEAAKKELREALAGAATAEQQQALVDAPLEEHRAAFGLATPDERVLPKGYREEYEQEYSGHEHDFLLAAREHGLNSKLVGELRDAGIRLAIEAEGNAVTEEAWGVIEKRFAGRLTAAQFSALKAWWRKSVEGGGAA